jgi:molybdopterin converting factor small subunit
MKVLLYGILRSIAGKKEITSKASSIRQLLVELADAFGKRMSAYLYEQDHVESLTVVKNGRVMTGSERAQASLEEGDIIELLSPIGGG